MGIFDFSIITPEIQSNRVHVSLMLLANSMGRLWENKELNVMQERKRRCHSTHKPIKKYLKKQPG